MFTQVRATGLQEFAWLRIVSVTALIAVLFVPLELINGLRSRTLLAAVLIVWAFWFLMLTGYYMWLLRRDGQVIFPESRMNR